MYVPIPTELFLHAYDDDGSGGNKGVVPTTTDTDKRNQLLLIQQQVYHGKTLLERIREDNAELVLVLRRWNGDLTALDFARYIQHLYKERTLPGTVATSLIRAVEDFVSSTTTEPQQPPPNLPRETDVFVLESLFKPHPQTGQSAIQRAFEDLQETPRHIPVAW